MPFSPVDPKQNFPKLEEEILKFWEEQNIFQRSIDERDPKNSFRFYDGPPFATGLPHYGHILAGTIKDVVPRFATMRGKRVERRFGWDCHGLPVENLIEKELGLSDKKAILDFGIDNFNEACRASVLRYTAEWRQTVRRMGRWVDFENDYKTMDPSFMESVWWVFGELWKKGLVYEGFKPMHICPRCVTPLANFEVNQGYADETDLSATVKFRINSNKCEHDIDFLAWTTTPWTLPGNVALAVGPEIEYAMMKKGDHVLVLAKNRLDAYAEQLEGYELFQTRLGKQFAASGLRYDPLFPYFSEKASEGAFRVIAADFVTTTDGTGIVHIAPAFGEDDLNAGKKEGLPTIQHVGMDGFMKSEVVDFAGKNVRVGKKSTEPAKLDLEIVEWLEKRGKLFASKRERHSYPHCWRCATPLLNYATTSWFVAVEKLKLALLENNEKISWVPDHLKNGRFGKWLEGARDWAISRNRYWGTPLPIWRCEECGATHAISSIAALEKLSGQRVDDLHLHKISGIEIPCGECGKPAKLIGDVFDCWFESGSMPYAQDATKSETRLPADFIAEGLDQTRGWFYTLHVLATALFDKPAFENVIVNGIVLAEDGQKMSKSKKNYPDPSIIFEKYGADAMRFYLMTSPVVKADDLRFSEKGVEEVLRSVILPLWNSYSFFVTYAAIDGWPDARFSVQSGGVPIFRDDGAMDSESEIFQKFSNEERKSLLRGALPLHPKNPLDRWILSSLESTKSKITASMERYDLSGIREIVPFLDGLTNWFIRRSRRRFWRSENDGDKMEGYAVLHCILVQTAQLLAPVCPFFTEAMFRNLTGAESIKIAEGDAGLAPSSVHLSAWPTVDEKWIDPQLEAKIDAERTIVSLGLSVRSTEKIKVRQPLEKAVVAIPTSIPVSSIDTAVLLDELNLKTIEFVMDASAIATLRILPNARLLGPKFGAEVQEIIREAKAGNFVKNADGSVVIAQKWVLTSDEIEIGFSALDGAKVASEKGFVVALDTQITPALKAEGVARDLIRAIAELRKTAGYGVADRIEAAIEADEKALSDAVLQWKMRIEAETLSQLVSSIEMPDATDEVAFDEGTVRISVRKAA